jgi:hypothetical protein
MTRWLRLIWDSFDFATFQTPQLATMPIGSRFQIL